MWRVGESDYSIKYLRRLVKNIFTYTSRNEVTEMNPTALYQSSSASLGNTKNNIFFNIISESDMDKPGLDKRAIFGFEEHAC